MKKTKVIIDTDPGVDDTLALILALHEPKLDIKLITNCSGNVNCDTATRNTCHLLDLFHKDIPVVQGAKKPMKRVSEDATFLHGDQGLGGYYPPQKTLHKPIKTNCADAMYKVITENPHEITIIALGPHTNLGILLEKHPDVVNLVKEIVYEGCAPFGILGNANYDSFNAKSDPEAQKMVLESKIPVVAIPSNVGRGITHFTENQVQELKTLNEVTKFIYRTFEIYWEPNMPDRRIATNDTCAVFYVLYKNMFKTKKAFMNIDTDSHPGKTKVTFDRKSHTKVVMNVNRKKFFKVIFKNFHKFDDFTFDEDILNDELQAKRKAELEKSKKTGKIDLTKKTTKKKA